MGIWKDIKHALNSTLGTSSFIPLDKKIDSVKSSIMAGGGIKVVKSVQRGVTTKTSITISTVNPQKCLVILNNSFLSYGYGSGNYISYVYGSIVKSLTENNLTITKNYYDYSSSESYTEVSWQIIEFY